MKRLILLAFLIPNAALAQQAASVDVIPWLQSQRNTALDAAAQCGATVTALQAKIADLEKQLAETKK
jgi:hypothetical protein